MSIGPTPLHTRYPITNLQPPSGPSPPVPNLKAGSVIEVAGFYCPYIPLAVVGPFTPVIERITLEIRENQGGHFDAVGVFTVNGRRPVPKETMDDLGVWCLEHWGSTGFETPAMWRMDHELIFAHDARMLFEMKMRWHGVEI